VIEALADVMVFRGIAENIRSDNRSEFVAEKLRKWLAKVGTARSTSSRAVCGKTATLFPEGGAGRDRKMAGPVRHEAAAQRHCGTEPSSQPMAVI
jgi:hypothetical protein